MKKISVIGFMLGMLVLVGCENVYVDNENIEKVIEDDSEVSDFKLENKKLITENKRLLKENLDFGAEIEKLKKDKFTLNANKTKKAEQEIASLNDDIKALESKNEEYETVVSDKIKEIKSLQEQNDNFRKEILKEEPDSGFKNVYTDKTVVKSGKFINTYYVRKNENSYCGINGTSVCELIQEMNHGGGFKTIADLLDPEETGDGRYWGGHLIGGLENGNLIIGYGRWDHGGGSQEVYEYDVYNKKLVKKMIEFGASESRGSGKYKADHSYMEKGEKSLTFVNHIYKNDDFTESGIYYKKGAEITKIDFEGEYEEIEFDILENYENGNLLEFKINEKDYVFDLDKGEFVE